MMKKLNPLAVPFDVDSRGVKAGSTAFVALAEPMRARAISEERSLRIGDFAAIPLTRLSREAMGPMLTAKSCHPSSSGTNHLKVDGTILSGERERRQSDIAILISDEGA